MKYGYFDLENKEYVITNPNTPEAWVNYLGSPEYGAIISNNAAGYSFIKSGANGRLIRHRFNTMSNDRPGRYIYIRDLEDNDYWSASWAPVCKDLEKYESKCQHGTAYTIISAKYKDISSEVLYYVPKDKSHEVWRLKIKNNSTNTRKLSTTAVSEFVNDNNYEQDQVNLQYTLFITHTYFKGNYILQKQNENLENVKRFLGLANQEVDAYCGDREKFIGRYRTYANPAGIENGLTNDLNFCENSCGALESIITLEPNQEMEFVYVLGQKEENEIQALLSYYNAPGICDKELKELKDYWHTKLNRFQVKTPDDKFNNIVNVWNAYNCFITFTWSRAASFYYCGLRNGFGYRDTVQDIQGIIHLDPQMAKDQIEFMLSAQVTNGAGLPLVKYTHNPGFENTPDDPEYVKQTGHPSYRADDALWLFPTIDKYINETGDIEFLNKVIYFADNQQKGTVYEHLQRAIMFSMNNTGYHGMPAGLHADWNDCLRLGKKGESTFVAFQLIYAINIIKKYAEYLKDSDYIKYLDEIYAKMDSILKNCWNEDRWIRGYTENGAIIGKRDDIEANMWLNPQSWSVISGYAGKEKGTIAMDSVEKYLNTPYGAMVMYPPFKEHGTKDMLMQCYNDTVKENAGIFSQPQGWLILAEAKLKRGNMAYKYFNETSPATYNENADLREMEPYVYGQFVEGKDSPFEGRCHVHWLTGTASTMMVGVTEGILGINPTYEGLIIDPAIPSTFTEYEMFKEFRGKNLNIKVNNPNGKQSGVTSVIVNGAKIDGLLIKESILKDNNEIVINM